MMLDVRALSPSILAEICRDAEARAPDEAVGAVLADIGGPRYVPLRNIHPHPRGAFEIAPDSLAGALHTGAVAGLVHSHHGSIEWGWYPSEADMRGQAAMALPWGIVAVSSRTGSATEPAWYGAPVSPEPLDVRPFRHGVTDCWGLVRDWYRSRGVIVADPPRGWGWWDDGKDLLALHLEAAGLEVVADSQPDLAALEVGDVLAMRIRADVPNHCAVVVGAGLMMHHLAGATPYDPDAQPAVEPIGRWLRRVERVGRRAAAGGAP